MQQVLVSFRSNSSCYHRFDNLLKALEFIELPQVKHQEKSELPATLATLVWGNYRVRTKLDNMDQTRYVAGVVCDMAPSAEGGVCYRSYGKRVRIAAGGGI